MNGDDDDRSKRAMDVTVVASAADVPTRALDAREQRAARAVPPPPPSAPGSVTAKFVRQHEELAALGRELFEHLDAAKIADDPSTVRRLLASFSGKLRVHAAMEQDALYPRLLASREPELRAKAQALLDDVGDVYEHFFKHLVKWSDAATVRADAESFCRETIAQLQRLAVRVKRENDELYPLVEGAPRA